MDPINASGRFVRDERLWVTLEDRPGRWWIHYNPHTHPGRFAVVDHDDNPLYVSRSDIRTCSVEATFWIDGYIHGAEPAPEVMFGDAIHEVDGDDPRWARWREALDDMHRRGDWNIANDVDRDESIVDDT